MTEKIKIVLLKRKMTVTALAKALGTSTSNVSDKFRRDNFNDKELQQIAEALDCDLDITLTLRDTGERITDFELVEVPIAARSSSTKNTPLQRITMTKEEEKRLGKDVGSLPQLTDEDL